MRHVAWPLQEKVWGSWGEKKKKRKKNYYLGLHLSLNFISASDTSAIMQIQAQKYADHILSDSGDLFT